MRRHEEKYALLQLEEYKPVADHKEEEPEVKGAEEVEHSDEEGQTAYSVLLILIGCQRRLQEHHPGLRDQNNE